MVEGRSPPEPDIWYSKGEERRFFELARILDARAIQWMTEAIRRAPQPVPMNMTRLKLSE